MQEVRAGLWHWQSPHPDWSPGEEWDEQVSSYAVDTGERLLLFDPLAVPDEVLEQASGRETAIVLTCPWHERDTRSLVDRIDAPVFAPRPEAAEDPMPEDDITAEQAADGSLAWLVAGEAGEAHFFTAGDRLPVGVEVLPGSFPNDLVLWIESHRALVTGDSLVDRGNGVELPVDWVPGATRDELAGQLRTLLELPVEHLLATHGGPTDRTALERALA